MGHGNTGVGFFNIDVEPLRSGQRKGEVFSAVIKFNTIPLSEEQLSDELKHLVDKLWDWQVKRVSETEFSVVFPTRQTLRLCTGRGKLYLPLCKIETKIREAFCDPKPFLVLPSAWVQLTGVLEDLLERERLMASFAMVGRAIDVDDLSLQKWESEPVRAESGPRGGLGGGSGVPPPPPPRQDKDDEDEDFSDDGSTDIEWNKHGRRKKGDQQEDPDKGRVGTIEAEGAQSTGKQAVGTMSAPVAGRVWEGPNLRISSNQYSSNLEMQLGLSKTLAMPAVVVLGADQEGALAEESLFSTEDGSLVTDPLATWVADSQPPVGPPAKVARLGGSLSGPERQPLEVLEEVQSVVCEGERSVAFPDLRKVVTEEALTPQAKRTPTIPYARKKKGAGVTATRKSARCKGTTPVMEKAQRRASEKDLEAITIINDKP
ncbi:hypothetical protein QYE76_068502 [Lolium multiflorum]|uniref:DUF4283 domain-containing protein n=1 Tax=Lolium multiflorum TaxID=4521 RepID=A0AAD8SGF1_LOLMU|nr:hypothetical protein QYE76_068502 [Lolium multiflorum]